jgi:hypothetical protein
MKMNHEVLHIIKEKIVKEYKDDIALLVLYNVNVITTEENKMGLDFYFIPETDRARELSSQFIIDGISFDLFPMPWERLISIAALDSPQAYLLTESEVVYCSGQNHQNRFDNLKESVSSILSPRYGQAMLNKAFEYFNETFIYLYNMDTLDCEMLDLRIEASKVITKIANALSFINHTYYKGGNGTDVSIIDESYKLKKLPKDYRVLVSAIMSANDANTLKTKTRTLIHHTRGLLELCRKEYAQIEPFETFFTGYYEELKSILTRFEVACVNKVQSKLFLLAAYMHEEVSQFMTKVDTGVWFNDRNFYSEYSRAFDDYFGVDFLDLIAKENYDELLLVLHAFEVKMINLLHSHDVELSIFEDTSAFKAYFESK